MRRLAHRPIAVAFVLCVLGPTEAIAESNPTAASVARIRTLFSDKAFTDAKCEALMKDDQPVFDCTYRGKGLQIVSTRGWLAREADIDADVFMVFSSAAALDVFPNTPELFHKLLRFNMSMDFCKLSVSADSTIMISALMKVSQINTPSDLEFMFDQVAACVGEFTTRFDKEKK